MPKYAAKAAQKPRYERSLGGAPEIWKSASERTTAVFPPLKPPLLYVGKRAIPNIGWPFLILRGGSLAFIPTCLILLPFLLIHGGPIWLLLIPWLALNIAFSEREYHKQVRRSHASFEHRLYTRTAELELWHEMWDDRVADNADFAMAEQAADEAVRKSRVSGAAIVVPKGTTVIGGVWTDMVQQGMTQAQINSMQHSMQQAIGGYRCTKCDGIGYVRGTDMIECSECAHQARVHDVLDRNKKALARSKALSAKHAKLLWDKKDPGLERA